MYYAILMKAFLAVHITAGFAAFLLAPVALATVKGGKQHKRWGMVYLWAMGIVAATALPMAVYRPVLFLALVAVFSFYLAFASYRVLKLKDLPRGGHAKPIDWIAAVITLVDGVALILLGAFRPAAIQVIGVVAIIFGIIAVRAPIGQMVMFIRKPKDKMFWIPSHLEGFIGSYIAAWSAFSVVTLTQVIGNHWYVWLWPTIVGVPAIVIMSKYYSRKFSPRIKAAAPRDMQAGGV
jgi:uncharacterized membrane protein